MKRDRSLNPTEAELEILQVLWSRGPSTVRDINEKLNQKREVGYTSTLKTMQIMVEKGLLTRNTEKRTHIYSADIDQDKTQKQLLKRFIRNTFQGAGSKMVMQILGSSKPTVEELEEIKALIDKLEKEQS